MQNETATAGPLERRLPAGVKCVGRTLTEDGGAAVVAPEGHCSPGQNARAVAVLQPGAWSFFTWPGLQQILEVLH